MKRVPQRTCIVCRTKGDKYNFLRVVRQPDDTFILDETGRAAGRGAYVCNNEQCLQKCLNTKALNRAFKTQVNEATYSTLSKKLGN